MEVIVLELFGVVISPIVLLSSTFLKLWLFDWKLVLDGLTSWIVRSLN